MFGRNDRSFQEQQKTPRIMRWPWQNSYTKGRINSRPRDCGRICMRNARLGNGVIMEVNAVCGWMGGVKVRGQAAR